MEMNEEVKELPVPVSKTKKIRRRVRKNKLPLLDGYLKIVLHQMDRGYIKGFYSCQKSSKGIHRCKSGRRSQYIGVSKNSKNWQVLANLHTCKKYVGTFPTEKEAAIVNDFYTIAYCGFRAMTNFTYSIELVKEMIQYYYDNEKDFNPEPFVHRVNTNC
mmetsp:Transcript_3717/g.4329  ORF Transcript_3717/g.4329 Transcript_3717/m.4329 type:complete len:159 (+) Transcript_3717:159-635(+)